MSAILTFLGLGKLQAAALAVLLAALAFAIWYGRDADGAWLRETKRADAAELQRDAFAKGLTQCRLDVAERNRTLAGMTALPEVRKRLCAQRGAEDACCKPAPAECKP